MSDRDPIDAMAPWTIKSVSTATRNAINAAARRENLTVGQWLEKRVSDWEGEGSPVKSPVIAASLAEIADMLRASTEAAASANIPLPKALARQSFALLDAAQRVVLGKPARAVRQRVGKTSGQTLENLGQPETQPFQKLAGSS
jgi:hypothetical protein